VSYDFLVWRSFPSSRRHDYSEGRSGWLWDHLPAVIPVKPGSTITTRVYVKQQDVKYTQSHIPVWIWNGEEWVRWRELLKPLPIGTFDWREFVDTWIVPEEAQAIKIALAGGAGGVTWWDDLRIYMDGELIYANDFTNWNPYIGAGLGAVLTGILTQLVTGKPEYSIGAGLLGGLGGAVAGYYFSEQV